MAKKPRATRVSKVKKIERQLVELNKKEKKKPSFVQPVLKEYAKFVEPEDDTRSANTKNVSKELYVLNDDTYPEHAFPNFRLLIPSHRVFVDAYILSGFDKHRACIVSGFRGGRGDSFLNNHFNTEPIQKAITERSYIILRDIKSRHERLILKTEKLLDLCMSDIKWNPIAANQTIKNLAELYGFELDKVNKALDGAVATTTTTSSVRLSALNNEELKRLQGLLGKARSSNFGGVEVEQQTCIEIPKKEEGVRDESE